jgi:hypothetical protein
MKRRRLYGLGAVLIAGLLIASIAFWALGGGRAASAYALAPESALPAQMRRAAAEVRDAYRFAVANRDTLAKFPCFCGCFLEAGHRSNADCYIRAVRPDGSVEFDTMSLG